MSVSESLVAAAAAATSDSTNGTNPPSRRTGATLPQIFKATYSGIPVYEFVCKGVAVMRRRSDSYLNATQILKVAEFDKPQRTRILEREVQKGEHEKVQGGYGKYQGTWVPFPRGVKLAQRFQIDNLLRPIFEYVPSAESPPLAPKHTTAATNRPRKIRDLNSRILPKPKKFTVKKILPKDGKANNTGSTTPTSINQPHDEMNNSDVSDSDWDLSSLSDAESFDEFGVHSDVSDIDSEATDGSRGHVKKRRKKISPDEDGGTSDYGQYAQALLNHFVSDSQDIPKILLHLPADFDVNLVIDDEGHSPLHWASAMARIKVLQVLMEHGANMGCINNAGQTPLIRSVLFSYNYDNRTSGELLELLHPTFYAQDQDGRTVLHHTVLMAQNKSRVQASQYYMACMVDRILRNSSELGPLVDVTDMHGDTALTIATRNSNKRLIKLLLKVGSDPKIKNKLGKSADDYATELIEQRMIAENKITPGNNQNHSNDASKIGGGPTPPHESASSSALSGRQALPVLLSKYLQNVDSAKDLGEVGAKLGVQEIDALLVTIKKEAEDTQKAINVLQEETDRIPQLQNQMQTLASELRQTVNKNQRLKLRSLVYQLSTEFPGPPSKQSADEVGGDDPSSKKEQLVADAKSLREDLATLQKDRKILVEEVLRLHLESGGLSRQARYRRLIAICCDVSPAAVDGLLTPLLTTPATSETSGDETNGSSELRTDSNAPEPQLAQTSA